MTPHAPEGVEIWGGIECTTNRVADRVHRQLDLSAHPTRVQDDLDAFSSLGITALRYPVLWEDVEPSPGIRDFASADRALTHLRAGPMRPIVGLLHHGSGPMSTSLLDAHFPSRFAEYARSVAQRYPWVEDYTPINEPLTTARFSGLYGHWYPHARDDRAFVRMLLNQARATVLAMRAIREVTPTARLIQTEDLGRADGTDVLRDQIRFENDRRWLSFDLLCGRVRPGHELHGYLTSSGATAGELGWFVENPLPPDILGINHYPRSNRWLDHHLERFDPAHRGGNDSLAYADVAASDTVFSTPASFEDLIDETSARFGLPVALTEVHVPGDAATRIAWWSHAVESADAAGRAGMDVRAVTTWSLLGSFDWDTLCTSDGPDLTYEPGVFDVSDEHRVETRLADAVRRSTTRVHAVDDGRLSA